MIAQETIMPDLLTQLEALLASHIGALSRLLAETRRLTAISGGPRSALPCKCPQGHAAIYYIVPDVVRCPICGIHDIAQTKTVELV
jgi:hypothetical protein